MSEARTQDKRFWIWVELCPQGAVTGGMFIDLNMVDKVDFAYENNPETGKRECFSAVIVYAGVLEPLKIGNAPEIDLYSARWFHDIWIEFLSGDEPPLGPYPAMPPAKPGLIQRVSNGPLKLG